MKTVEERFKEFAAKALRGIDIDSVQYIEMERAFYAGIFCVMTDLRVAMSAPEGTPEQEEAAASAVVDGVIELHNESRAFFLKMKRDNAQRN